MDYPQVFNWRQWESRAHFLETPFGLVHYRYQCNSQSLNGAPYDIDAFVIGHERPTGMPDVADVMPIREFAARMCVKECVALDIISKYPRLSMHRIPVRVSFAEDALSDGLWMQQHSIPIEQQEALY